MRHAISKLGAVAVICAVSVLALAQGPVSTGWTYQGQLKDAGAPADGDYDMRFALFDATSGGSRTGPLLTFDGNGGNPPPVTIVEGVFTVELDFGAGIFTGDARWLAVEVRPTGVGQYTPLDPRQPLTAAPYALFALNGPGSGGFWQPNGNDIFNNNSGNVGIGTASPQTTLDVFGEDAVLRVESIRTDSGPKLVFRNRTTGDGITDGTIQFQDANNTVAEIKYHRPGFGGLPALNLVTAGGGMGIFDNGAVGIGVEPGPGFKLDVNDRIRLRQGASVGAGIWFWQNGPAADRGFVGMHGNDQIGFFSREGSSWGLVMRTDTGDVGIGDTSPNGRLGVFKDENDGRAALNATNSGTGSAGFFATTNSSNTSPALFAASVGSALAFSTLGDVVINGDTTIHGTATVDVLEITGADLAERFPVSEEVKPGMVMEIDPDHAGKLRLSRGMYNRRVAGVASGAGDIPTGAILGNLAGHKDAPPVALSGRVWVYCDASETAIELGDLLTTSATPGHAMAVRDFTRSPGATLGKAMTPLAKGETGLVLVLVSL